MKFGVNGEDSKIHILQKKKQEYIKTEKFAFQSFRTRWLSEQLKKRLFRVGIASMAAESTNNTPRKRVKNYDCSYLALLANRRH